MVLYLHLVVGPNANQKTIIPTKPGESLFGITAVNNWAIVDAPDFKAKVVGHAQGIHVMADQPSVGYYNSFNLAFVEGRQNLMYLYRTINNSMTTILI